MDKENLKEGVRFRVGSLYISDKKKDGTPRVDKNGKHYTLVMIAEGPDAVSYSCLCYGNEKELSIQKNTTIEIDTWSSGDFHNFQLSQSPLEKLGNKIKSGERWLARLREEYKQLEENGKVKEQALYGLDIEDVLF